MTLGTTQLEPLVLAVLLSNRESLRSVLLLLPLLPEDRRGDVRAGAIKALGAIEDALGEKRTFPTRDERRRERVVLDG